MLSGFSQKQLFAGLRTVAHQAPLSMGFSRQEYWSGLPCPLPGILPDLGIEPPSLMSPTLAGRVFTTSATGGAPLNFYFLINYFWLCCRACWILVPWLGIEPKPWQWNLSSNNWNAKEFSQLLIIGGLHIKIWTFISTLELLPGSHSLLDGFQQGLIYSQWLPSLFCMLFSS